MNEVQASAVTSNDNVSSAEQLSDVPDVGSFADAVLVRTWRIAANWHYAAADFGAPTLLFRGSYGTTRDRAVDEAVRMVREHFPRLAQAQQSSALAYWSDKQEWLRAAVAHAPREA